MYAVSVARPWAPLLAAHLKDVENRRYRPPRHTMTVDGGWIVVHASRKWHPAALTRATAVLGVGVLDRIGADGEFGPAAATGYIGVMRVAQVCSSQRDRHSAVACDCGPWAEMGSVHWRTDEAHAFAEAAPGPGRLGCWPAPAAVEHRARRLIELAGRRGG